MIQPKPVIDICDASIPLLVEADFWGTNRQISWSNSVCIASAVPLLPRRSINQSQWLIDSLQCQPLAERDNLILSK